MTDSVILGIIALILMTAFGVTVTVLVSRALSRAFFALDQMHMRSAKHQDKLLDRLMTIRWEDYVATQTLEGGDQAGFFAPGEDEEDEKEPIQPLRWGALSTARERMDLTPDEQAILDEDFPEEVRT